MFNRTISLVVLSVALSVIGGNSNAAPKTAEGSWNGNFQVRNSETMVESCSNSNGNQIKFSGTVFTIGGIVTQITATNNLKGTKGFYVLGEAQVDLDFTDTAPVYFEKRGSVDGGVGGNPWIGFYYNNPPAADDIVLGRCVQGARKNIDRDGIIQNALRLTLSTSECSPSRTTINSFHNHNSTGVNGTIFLTNSTNNYRHYDDASGILSASIQNFGGLNPINGSNGRAIAGGNPHLYLEAWVAERDDNGNLKRQNGRLVKSATKISLSNLGTNGYAGRCRDLAQ